MGCVVVVERIKADLDACDQRLAELRQQLSLARGEEFDRLRCAIAEANARRDWLEVKLLNEEWRQ